MVDLILELVDARALGKQKYSLSELMEINLIHYNKQSGSGRKSKRRIQRYFETISKELCMRLSKRKRHKWLAQALESYKSPKMLSMEQRV